jgi:hypothetical protein
MLEVVAIVCSLVGVCRDIPLAVTDERITPFSCFLFGQTELAKWSLSNPGWSPKRITCQRVGRYAKA